jgi:hypothetical protein
VIVVAVRDEDPVDGADGARIGRARRSRLARRQRWHRKQQVSRAVATSASYSRSRHSRPMARAPSSEPRRGMKGMRSVSPGRCMMVKGAALCRSATGPVRAASGAECRRWVGRRSDGEK